VKGWLFFGRRGCSVLQWVGNSYLDTSLKLHFINKFLIILPGLAFAIMASFALRALTVP
jgi:hypothetical protein